MARIKSLKRACRDLGIAYPRRKPAGYRPLLQTESDAKTSKGTKMGWLTAILYLAPADMSGVINTCSNSSCGCRNVCLVNSGLAAVHKSINRARIAKTKFMVSSPAAFDASLRFDIDTLRIKAYRRNLRPAARLNGTSDLPKIATAMAALYPDVMFYDYTKHPRPQLRQRENYRITFSHAENNMSRCLEALANGVNVAVVFDTKKGQPLPETWHGYPVFNGDNSDLRFLDPAGHVIGLYAKGPAKKDCSGFVVRTAGLIQISPLALAA